jgi:hypothetical protein
MTHDQFPEIGATRYWFTTSGTQMGTVLRVSPDNEDLRKGYTGIIGPPPFEQKPHVELSLGYAIAGRACTAWVALSELYLTKEEVDEIVSRAFRMNAAASRSSAVDPLW